jgi:hypothetical protein
MHEPLHSASILSGFANNLQVAILNTFRITTREAAVSEMGSLALMALEVATRTNYMEYIPSSEANSRLATKQFSSFVYGSKLFITRPVMSHSGDYKELFSGIWRRVF